MKIAKFVLPVIAAGFAASSAMAATSSIEVDATNTVAGTVANAITADGEGADWTGAVLVVDLTGGSVHNELAGGNPQDTGNSGFWGFVPSLKWDTWLGPVNNASIAGGGGDLGGGTFSLDGPISASWFNTTTVETSALQIANISLSADAQGTWALIASFAGGVLVQSSGEVIDGAMVPEPASLALLGLGGIAALRRR